ncbi:MAG: hypothetical protein AAGE96_17080 [Cyanobacteria bacterium P01_G01_bin.19]
MNEKEQLIKEIEQAPDFLVKEVLDFLLFTKSRAKYLEPNSTRDLETQLRAMAEDREVQAEITAIEREFLVTEMDGLTST